MVRKIKTVFVGMSGGVDSSVAAFLLKKKGYAVVGVFMRCYNLDGCAERDAEDARRVAEHIGIPFYVWDFEEEYKRRVVDYMIEGYRAGITPNPDVMCNREIKFGLFLKKALAAGADFVATGHYVRKQGARSELQIAGKIKEKNSPFAPRPLPLAYLREAKDKNKDQSYFLWTLKQDDLKHCLFPIGDYMKREVRRLAKQAGLPTAMKKDSQGICFLGDVNVRDFLRQYIPRKLGALMTTAGERIGEHHGAAFYTIGERHINVNFKFPKTGGRADRQPFYVAEKNIKTNMVIVAEGSENPALYRKEIELANANFLSGSPLSALRSPLVVFARVRYRELLSKARIQNPESRIQKRGGKLKLIFDTPQKFVAPGQSAVLYDKNGIMLGGGIII
jgi:tRNA-uridine 2-sulfurtransferase